jgi:short-subunit dehydrogenase
MRADRLAVITGVASGIGLATARAFAAKGARLALVAVDAAGLEELKEELQGRSIEVLNACNDRRDSAALGELAPLVEDRWRSAVVSVNNAGVGHAEAIEETSLEDRGWVLEINLKGVIRGVHAFLPGTLAGRHGRIVNMESVAGLVGTPRMAPYSASKFAVAGLTEGLAVELAGRGVSVIAECPAPVRTRIIESDRFGEDEALRDGYRALFRRHGMAPARIAALMLRSCRRPRTIITGGLSARLRCALKRLHHGLCRRLLGLAERRVMGR